MPVTTPAFEDDMDDFDITEEDLLALEMESSQVISGPPTRPDVQAELNSINEKQNWQIVKPMPQRAHIEEDYSEINLDELESQLLSSNPRKQFESVKNSGPSVQHKEKDVNTNEQITDNVFCKHISSIPVSKKPEANSSNVQAQKQQINVQESSMKQKMQSNIQNDEPPLKKLKGIQSDIRSFAVNKAEVESKPNLSKQTQNMEVVPTTVAANPFVYLCQLQHPNTRPNRCVVKACIITLLQKLKADNGDWNLKLRIGDGSANLDVQFSNEVIRCSIYLCHKIIQ